MSNPGTSNSSYRPHKWLFSKDEMHNAKTIKEGWDSKKELEYRQRATRCIQEMVDKLNDTVRDKAGKVTQLCMCAASIHMHRFYYFHSFQQFQYLDVAAACLFLAGKSEESPRKLDHILHVWWAMKFPKYKKFPPNNQQIFNDSRAYIVQLENIVLQTIAFDLKIELPHPIVLNVTSKYIGQVLNDHSNKKLTECAYFFATDVLCVTNWAIRYSAAEIAVCCVDIVCNYGEHKIPKRADGAPWYHDVCTMPPQKLQEMEQEFITIYNGCKYKLALHKFAAKGIVCPPMQYGSIQRNEELSASSSVTPHQPPQKTDFSQYKERNKVSHNDRPAEKPRKSFIPDSSAAPLSIGLEPIDFSGTHSLPFNHDRHKEDRKEDERKKEKKRKEDRPEERNARKEEERKRKDEDRRKREQGRTVGPYPEDLPYKKPRPIDVMHNFVPASPNVRVLNNGHHHKDFRGIVSSMKVEGQLSPPRAPSLSNYLVQTLPPPPVAPMLNASPAPRLLKNELEDGELE